MDSPFSLYVSVAFLSCPISSGMKASCCLSLKGRILLFYCMIVMIIIILILLYFTLGFNCTRIPASLCYFFLLVLLLLLLLILLWIVSLHQWHQKLCCVCEKCRKRGKHTWSEKVNCADSIDGEPGHTGCALEGMAHYTPEHVCVSAQF